MEYYINMMENIKRLECHKDTLLGDEINVYDEVRIFDKNNEKLVIAVKCSMESIGMINTKLICEFNNNIKACDNIGYTFKYNSESDTLTFSFYKNTLDITTTKDPTNNAMEMMGFMSNAIIKDCFNKINKLRKEIGE